ncbi:hypothetical protein KY336_00305 [Candidatus Woesearchaeota archaeon]|nr:hypothetical protein [Candidatus Woesearchaeota archaeon]
MKHTFIVTIILILLFFVSQVIGLAIIKQYIDVEKTAEEGVTVFKELPFGQERPPVEQKVSYIFIIIAVLVGTAIAFGLIKFKLWRVWKVWFFLAVWMCVTIAFAAYVNQWIALAVALVLAGWKIFKPNSIVHNLTEMFIYAGIAAILVPIMNLFAAIMMLILISIYDYVAVFKSKHMIKLAQAQSKARVFAGLQIPYGGLKEQIKTVPLSKKAAKKVKEKAKKKKKKVKLVKVTRRTAILGGGDMAFALLFIGTAMKYTGFPKAIIIAAVTTAALSFILFHGRKDRFYPAMPFISVGCVLGYLLVAFI